MRCSLVVFSCLLGIIAVNLVSARGFSDYENDEEAGPRYPSQEDIEAMEYLSNSRLSARNEHEFDVDSRLAARDYGMRTVHRPWWWWKRPAYSAPKPKPKPKPKPTTPPTTEAPTEAPTEEPITREKPAACFLAMKAGSPCNRVQRYFYNAETGKCEEFTYGGCFGNANRFPFEADCKTACRV